VNSRVCIINRSYLGPIDFQESTRQSEIVDVGSLTLGHDKLCLMTPTPWFRDGQLGWAASDGERDDQIAAARRLEGLRITRVHYFTLDYKHLDLSYLPEGPRVVTDPIELPNSPCRYDDFDSVDFYIQIESIDQRSFTIGWDPPSETEGLWVREGVTSGEPFASNTRVAVWDVTDSRRWSSSIGRVVSEIGLHYRQTAQPAGWGCDLLTLVIGGKNLSVFLGDVGEMNSMKPSANNLLVITSPTQAPEWIVP